MQSAHARSWQAYQDVNSRSSMSRPAPDNGGTGWATARPSYTQTPTISIKSGHRHQERSQTQARESSFQSRTASKHHAYALDRHPSQARVHQHLQAPAGKPYPTPPASPYASTPHYKSRSSKQKCKDVSKAPDWTVPGVQVQTSQPAEARADKVQAQAWASGEVSNRPAQGACAHGCSGQDGTVPTATVHTPPARPGLCVTAEWPSTVRSRPKQASQGSLCSHGSPDRPQAATWAAPRGSSPAAPVAASSVGNRRAAWMHAAVRHGGDRELQPLQFDTDGACGSCCVTEGRSWGRFSGSTLRDTRCVVWHSESNTSILMMPGSTPSTFGHHVQTCVDLEACVFG